MNHHPIRRHPQCSNQPELGFTPSGGQLPLLQIWKLHVGFVTSSLGGELILALK
jgi:hypothetical protein